MISTLVLAHYGTLLCTCPTSDVHWLYIFLSPAETYLGGDCDPGKPAGQDKHRHLACSRSSLENMLVSSCENTTHTKKNNSF